MPVSDDQLELLETYIDGELPESKAVALQLSLHADPDLTAALHALRADREVRVRLFESLEPDAATANRLFKGVQNEITRDIVWGERLRIVRYIGAAAACVAFSFFAGWVGRSHLATPPVLPGSNEQPLVMNATEFHQAPVQQKRDEPSLFGDQFTTQQQRGSVQQASQTFSPNTFSPGDVQRFTIQAPPQRDASESAIDTSGLNMGSTLSTLTPRAGTPNLVGTRRPGGYQVALTDTNGHIVAVQHFETLEEARDFQQDVSRWQQHIENADAVIQKDRF